MLPCYNCYICRTWKIKEVGGLKLSYRGKEKATTRGTFMGRRKKTTQGVDH